MPLQTAALFLIADRKLESNHANEEVFYVEETKCRTRTCCVNGGEDQKKEQQIFLAITAYVVRHK